MLISIVIPTRNRRDHLRITLDALLADEYRDKEIIVMDAASTDGTVDLLRTYGDKVRWISEKDGGEHFARNKGFDLVTGELVQFGGDDNVLQPGSFEFAAQFMKSHPEVDIMFGQARRYCEGYDGSRILMDSLVTQAGPLTAKSFIRGATPNVMSDTAFFRRSLVGRIGKFNTAFLGADYEFWARAAHLGCRLEMTEKHIIEYIISMKSAVILKKKRLVYERRTLAKLYGTFSDRLYVNALFVPRQIFVDWLHRILPWKMERALRKIFWSIKDPSLRAEV